MIEHLILHIADVAPTVAAAPSVDYTALVVAVIGGLFSAIGAVGVALINARIKDKQAADTLDKALTNSLGAVQNALTTGLKYHPLQVSLGGVSPSVAEGVQYALDHAAPEVARLGITPVAIAEKIEARMGLATVKDSK